MITLQELADTLILRARGLDAYGLQKDQRAGWRGSWKTKGKQ